MTPDVEIASAALVHLGRDPIADLDDPGGYSRIIAARYVQVAEALLRTYPWNFAMRQAALAGTELPKAQRETFRWACALPAGGASGRCLKVWSLEGCARDEWRVAGRDLLCRRTPPVTIWFVDGDVEPGKYDPLFCELLAIELALATLGRIAPEGARARLGDLRREQARLRREARLADAREGSPDEIGGQPGSWAAARRPM